MASRRASAGPPSPQRAVGLIRVSTREQAEGGISLEMQEQRIAAFCAAQAWELTAVYREPGFSGGGWHRRPGIRALLRDLSNGRPPWDAVVVYRLDRLGRSVRHVVPFLGELADRGLSWRSTSEPQYSDESAIGKALVTVAAAFAQLQRDLTGELVADARRQIASEGRWSGRAPTGYRCIDGKLEANDEAWIVRRAFSLYVDQSWGIGRVARVLMQESGPRWTASLVRRLLARPTYAGFVALGGQLFRGQHAPLVSEATWREAVSRLEVRGRVGRDTTRRCHLLSGLLRCPLCNGPMWGTVMNDRRFPVYFCGRAHRSARRLCRGRAISARKAEGALLEAFREAARKGGSPGPFQYVPRPSLEEEAAEEVRRDLAGIPQRRAASIDLAVRGKIPEDDLTLALANLEAEEQRLQETARQFANPRTPSVTATRRAFRDLADLLEDEGISLERKRTVLAECLEAVVVETSGDVRLRIYYPI